MEDSGVTLSDEEVRERFSAFHEGELPEGEMNFVRRRLAESASLRTEFERFRKMLSGLASIGLDDEELGIVPEVRSETDAAANRAPGARTSTVAEARASRVPGERASQAPRASRAPGTKSDEVDLLPEIQDRLHKRSRGKFYRTRYSRRAGTFSIEILAGVILLLLLLVWVGTTFITNVTPAQPRPATQGGAGSAGDSSSSDAAR